MCDRYRYRLLETCPVRGVLVEGEGQGPVWVPTVLTDLPPAWSGLNSLALVGREDGSRDEVQAASATHKGPAD